MHVWSALKEMTLAFVGNFLYGLSFFVPKKQDIWIFGGLMGNGYNDNSKYFFEYINKHKKNLKPIWITQNKNIAAELTKRGFKSYTGYSFKGICLSMRAGVAIISHSRIRDLKPFVITPRVKFVQLWHGIPLKKIEFDDTMFFNKSSIRNKIAFLLMNLISPAFRRKFDLFISCSKEDQKNFASAFRLPINRVVITGYPRNDAIVKSMGSNRNKTDTRKILYMPTFRGQEKSSFDLFEKFGFDFERMEQFLNKENMTLYIKLHPLNQPTGQFLKKIADTAHIMFFKQTDIYDKIGNFDILITDYSSIYFDFLLLDKPIVFAPFDMKHYLKKDRKLYYEYNDVTPGPKAFNWIEVEQQLNKIANHSQDYHKERQDLKKRFHLYLDAESSDRVYNQIINLIIG